MERDEALMVLAADPFHLGEAVEHPQVYVVRVGFGDLPGSLFVSGWVEAFQLDRRPDPGRILENNRFRFRHEASFLFSMEDLIHHVSSPCSARLRRRAARVPSTIATASRSGLSTTSARW